MRLQAELALAYLLVIPGLAHASPPGAAAAAAFIAEQTASLGFLVYRGKGCELSAADGAAAQDAIIRGLSERGRRIASRDKMEACRRGAIIELPSPSDEAILRYTAARLDSDITLELRKGSIAATWVGEDRLLAEREFPWPCPPPQADAASESILKAIDARLGSEWAQGRPYELIFAGEEERAQDIQKILDLLLASVVSVEPIQLPEIDMFRTFYQTLSSYRIWAFLSRDALEDALYKACDVLGMGESLQLEYTTSNRLRFRLDE